MFYNQWLFVQELFKLSSLETSLEAPHYCVRGIPQLRKEPTQRVDNSKSISMPYHHHEKKSTNSPVSSFRGLPWGWVGPLWATLGAPRVPRAAHCTRYDARSSPYRPSSSRCHAQWGTSRWGCHVWTAPRCLRKSPSDSRLLWRPGEENCAINKMIIVQLILKRYGLMYFIWRSYGAMPLRRFGQILDLIISVSLTPNHCSCKMGAFNSLCPSDNIWRHKSGFTLAQVMTYCLTATSHYNLPEPMLTYHQ